MVLEISKFLNSSKSVDNLLALYVSIYKYLQYKRISKGHNLFAISILIIYISI